MKVVVVYYTMNGHTHRLAEAVAEGARQVRGTEVVLCRVPETLSPADLRRRGGERMSSETELAGARFLGKHVAEIASKLSR